MNLLKEYWAYVAERAAIRRWRMAGAPWPWTADPILREYSFTNAKREWDRTTQWLVNNWYKPNNRSLLLPLNVALARQIGKIETLEYLQYQHDWDPEYIINRLRVWRNEGHSIYTNAYMITAIGMRTRFCQDKIEYTVKHVVGPLEKVRFWGTNVEDTVPILCRWHGWAGFMAQEVALDLSLTGLIDPSPDWAHAGPGAKRGLNVLYRREPKAALRDTQALEEMRFIRSTVPQELKSLQFTVHDIEFSLCEWFKYYRAKNLGQRPKNKYVRK